MSNARTLANIINSSSEIVVPSGGVNFGTSTDGSGTVSTDGGILHDNEEGIFNRTMHEPKDEIFELRTNADTMHYTKINNRIWISGRVIIDSIPNQPGGSEFYLSNLPFQIRNPVEQDSGSSGSVTYYDSSATNYLSPQIPNVEGLVAGRPYSWRMFKSPSSIGSGDQITFGFSYLTS